MASGIIRRLAQQDMGGNKISSLATGTAATDAVNYGQVQSLLAGAAHYIDVRASASTNVSLTAPGTAIDGVTLVSGDSVLLRGQTTQSQNGVYVWTGAAATLTRRTDSQTQANLIGQVVTVTEGSASNADKAFIQQTVGTITLETTNLTYGPFLAGATYTGTNGVTVSGTTISAAVAAGGGVLAAAGGLSVDTTVVVRKAALSVGNGAATTFTVTHNLGTFDVQVEVYDTTTNTVNDTVDVDVLRPTVNTVTINVLGFTPTTNQLRVLISG